MFVRNCGMKRQWVSRFVTSWLSEKSTWLWLCGCSHFKTSNFRLPDCQRIVLRKRMFTSWLHDCQKLEPEYKWPSNFRLHVYPELGSTWNWTTFSDSHSARYLPLSHEDSPKTSRQLSSVQFVWHHCDSWGAWCVRNWIGICYFAPVLDTYNRKLIPNHQLSLHYTLRRNETGNPQLFTLVDVLSPNRITVIFDRDPSDLQVQCTDATLRNLPASAR